MERKQSSHILSVANLKGGPGKSTLTLLFATTMVDHFGLSVMILDCDHQRSIERKRNNELNGMDKDKWGKNKADIKGCDINKLDKELLGQVGKYDVIFIDLPGFLDVHIVEVFAYTDVVIIPVVMNEFDVASTMDFVLNTMKTVKKLKNSDNERFDYYGILNKYSRKLENRQVGELSEELGLEFLTEGISGRVKYDRNLSTMKSMSNGNDDELYLATKDLVKKVYNN